jgi:hypothetical protein
VKPLEPVIGVQVPPFKQLDAVHELICALHLGPVHPVEQEHAYAFTNDKHVAPFAHGFDEQ